ncbi:MAG: chloride channel protein [Anaerovoracaceae bacterium]
MELNKKNKNKYILILVLFGSFLGFFAGIIISFTLKIMSLGIHFVWHYIPKVSGVDGLAYYLIVCALGGLIIGLYQKKFGVYPETMEEVMKVMKDKGYYPYDKLHIILVAALLPLIFGGSLGPEAGLTGVIVGLCCLIGHRLEYKGEELRELAMSGVAATLSLVFQAPFFGIANNIEEEANFSEIPQDERVFTQKERKKIKSSIYVFAVIAGLIGFKFVGLFIEGGTGIPRFDYGADPTFEDWKWFFPICLAGVLAGLVYQIGTVLFSKISKVFGNKNILRCIVGGLGIGIIGFWVPFSMFSGEHELGEIISSWSTFSAVALIGIGVCKLLLTGFCLNFGWIGGNIFPIIFSGTSIGFAMVSLLGINPIFGVAVVTAAVTGYIMKKPIAVVGILILCFPIKLVIPMVLSAYISSLIPDINKNS